MCAVRRTGNLASLKSLEIAKNAITGSIPDGALHQIPVFHAAVKHHARADIAMVPCYLTSSTPEPLVLVHKSSHHAQTQPGVWHSAGIAALSSLKLLDLSDNIMSGPLPSDWSRATQLSFMLLENNAFSGAYIAPALHHRRSQHRALMPVLGVCVNMQNPMSVASISLFMPHYHMRACAAALTDHAKRGRANCFPSGIERGSLDRFMVWRRAAAVQHRDDVQPGGPEPG